MAGGLGDRNPQIWRVVSQNDGGVRGDMEWGTQGKEILYAHHLRASSLRIVQRECKILQGFLKKKNSVH